MRQFQKVSLFCLDGVNNISGADGSDENDELEERAAAPENDDILCTMREGLYVTAL